MVVTHKSVSCVSFVQRTLTDPVSSSAANGGQAAQDADVEDPVSMAGSIKKAASKRRLYSKFVKAKDASSYSDADKAKIFGSAGRKKEKELNDDAETTFGKTSTMSMADYFKQKMAAAGAGGGDEPPRRSPRLAGLGAEEASMGGLGLGSGPMTVFANQRAEPDPAPKKKEITYKFAQPSKKESKKRKKEEQDDDEGSKEKEFVKKTSSQKLIRRLLKAADNAMRVKKLEKEFVVEYMKKNEGLSKKEAKQQFSVDLESLPEITVKDELASLGKKDKKQKKTKTG